MSSSQKCFDFLLKGKWTFSTIESLTAGHLSALFVEENPGASQVYLGSLITYSNELKEKMGVYARILADFGAVSKPCCEQMLDAAQKWSGADWILATTGVAGPDGGTTEKPVGTVFIGISFQGTHLDTVQLRLQGNRKQNIEKTCDQAFNLFASWLKKTLINY